MARVATEESVRIRRWEQATDWPLMASAVIFLVAYTVSVLLPSGPGWMLALCTWAIWVTWALFALDLVVRVFLVEDRLRYLARRWYDVLILALPLLRPLRLLRFLMLLSVLNRRARNRLRGRVMIYVGGGASLLAFCAALAVLDAERASPEANIRHFGDAVWWTVTTMTTVGYGDHYPVTWAGRLVAFTLMLSGIALLSTVTATLASWLVEAVAAEKEQAEDLEAMIRRLEAKVDHLEDNRRASGVDHP